MIKDDRLNININRTYLSDASTVTTKFFLRHKLIKNQVNRRGDISCIILEAEKQLETWKLLYTDPEKLKSKLAGGESQEAT